MATTAQPPGVEETSLANIGFTEDANAGETGGGAAAEPEPEQEAEQLPTEAGAVEEAAPEEAAAESAEGEAEPAAEAEIEPSGYDMLLPAKQQKSYPDELISLAAQKFGLDPSLLTQKPVRDLLKGKIDSDIDSRNLREQLQAASAEPGEEEDAGEEEPGEAEGAESGAEAVSPQRQLEATMRLLREGFDGTPIVSDEGAKLYSDTLLDGYTALQQAIDSGDEKQVAAAQRKFTESQLAFATVAFANVFPALLPRMLQNMPAEMWTGIVGGQLEQREEMRATHKSARDLLGKDPHYGADLTRFIKSGKVFEFVKENPEVLQKQFRDANGRPVTDPTQRTIAQYKFVVHQLRGQEYKPAQEYVKQGIKAGERNAAEIARKKALGRTAPGRTQGVIGERGDRYGDKEWVERMKRAAAASNPLGQFLEQVKP